MASKWRTMRIAVVTPLFPTAEEPHRGLPIFQTVQALKHYADVSVCSIHAAYPREAQRNRVTYSESSGVHVTQLTYPGVPLLSRPWNGAVSARYLYPHVAEIKPDLVLSYWIYPEGYGALRVADALGVKSIVSSRGSDLRAISDPITRRKVSETLARSAYVLTVSEDLRRRAIALGSSPDRTVTIPNGVDHRLFRFESQAEGRRRLGLAGDSKIILYVGRQSKEKGVPELLASFADLAKSDPALQLVCIGDGPLKSRAQATAAALGFGDRARMLGSQPPSEIARWMHAADVFCLPSYSEGCPNVVIEALACGCPVVATDVGGIPDLVNTSSSLLVAPGDGAALAAALRAGLSRNWDRAAVSAACTRTWDDVAKETVAACEAAVSQSARKLPARRTSKRLKITVVTSYFPISEATYRGHSAFHTLLYLKDMADVNVICPLAAYPHFGGARLRFSHDRDYTHHPKQFPTTYVGYPAIPGLTRPINGWVCERILLPLLRASQPDVVLNYWLYPDGFGAVQAGRKLGVPVIVGSIGSDLRCIADPVTRHFVRRTLAESAGVITVSEELRQQALAFGIDPGKVTAILNGCDTSIFFNGDRAEARASLGVPAQEEIVLFVGSMLESKGLPELIAAFAAMAATRPGVRLVMIGEGPYAAIAERDTVRLRLQGRISVLGAKSSVDVGRWMRACDIFCLPSRSEGCPNVVVEALCSGRPVVASDIGGIPELVDASCGILTPPGDSGRLRTALETALTQRWDTDAIAARLKRGWQDVAADTYAVCLRLYQASLNGAPEQPNSQPFRAT